MKVLMGEHLGWRSVFKVGSHYFAEMFIASGHKVAWLSASFHPLKYFRDKVNFMSQYKIWLYKGNENRNIWEYNPFFLFPYRDFPIFNQIFFNRNCYKFSFPNLVSFLERRDWLNVDILWITNILDYRWTLEKVRYKLSVYRAPDLVSGFRVNPSNIEKVEEEIVRKVDIVLTSSKKVYNKFKSYKQDSLYYIPNAVDIERFKIKYPEPKEYRGLNGKKVIYVGAIDEWVDLEIIAQIAVEVPNINIVIIGKERVSMKGLRKYKNIHILGPKSPCIIPAYLQHASVGIIPFKKNSLTDCIHPVKLYEYLASGLPVVSKNLEEIKNTGLPVLMADEKDEFVEKILESFGISTEEKERLRKSVTDHTWERRFEIVKRILSIQ